MRARTHSPSLAPGAPGRARSAQASGAGAARLQLLQRQVGNRTLARMFDKGFWIVEADGTYTWHAGTDATGFVPSGLPNYKIEGVVVRLARLPPSCLGGHRR